MKKELKHRNSISAALKQKYEITFPNGEIVISEDLIDFCKKYNLPYSSMSTLSRIGRVFSKGPAKNFKIKKL
jgi:hypothetical protein